MYFGGMAGQSGTYEFMQLTRHLEGPGTLSEGSFDFAFFFKNVDLETDTYCGISMDVIFEVVAEMSYQGSVMNHLVEERVSFRVRNV